MSDGADCVAQAIGTLVSILTVDDIIVGRDIVSAADRSFAPVRAAMPQYQLHAEPFAFHIVLQPLAGVDTDLAQRARQIHAHAAIATDG